MSTKKEFKRTAMEIARKIMRDNKEYGCQDSKLVFEKIERSSDDGVLEAFFHDAENIYFVRDEPGALLNYASSR